MTSSLEQLISELGPRAVGKEVFSAVLGKLEMLPHGEGLLALRKVISTKLDFGVGGCAAKKLAVNSLIQACKWKFPLSRRDEVIESMTKDWDKESEENIKEILRVLEMFTFAPNQWDLSAISFQVAGIVDCGSDGAAINARSLLSSIRLVK